MTRMSQRASDRTLLGLCFLVIASFGFRTVSTYGIGVHLAVGRSILSQGIPRTDPLSFSFGGQPWVDGTWLYDALMYLAARVGGMELVSLLHLLTVVLAFLLVLPILRRWCSLETAALTLLLCAWLIAPVYHPAPGIFALWLPVFFIRVGERLGSRWPSWVILGMAQVFWANLHGSFLLGPFVVLLTTLAPPPVPQARTSSPGRSLGLAGFLAGLTLLNPYGPHLHRHTLAAWNSPAANYVHEWISPVGWQFSTFSGTHLLTVALAIGASGIITYRSRLPLTALILAAVSAVLVIVRPHLYQEWFAILAAPFLGLSLEAAADQLDTRLPASWRGIRSTTLRACILLIGIFSLSAVTTNQFYRSSGSASNFGLGMEAGCYPEAAATILDDPAFPARAVNLAHDGGYLAWRYPQRKVFVDQRADLYGAGFYQHLALALSGDPERLREFEDHWEPMAFILNCALPGAVQSVGYLLDSDRWSLNYFDGRTAVLLRKVSENRALLDSHEVHTAGLKHLEDARRDYYAGQSRFVRPSFSLQLYGAAQMFVSLRRYEEALSILPLLIKGSPNLPFAWIGAGYCQIALGKAKDAVVTLEAASRRFEENVQVWLWLSRAYELAGREVEAAQAFQQASRMNPGLAAQFRQEGLAELESPGEPNRAVPSLPGLLP